MRRALLAAGAISFCLAGFHGSAQAGDLYRIKNEQKSGVQQNDGNWLFEEYSGIQKFNPSTNQWSSIFDGDFPLIRSADYIYGTSFKNNFISARNYASIFEGRDYQAASVNNLYAYGSTYDDQGSHTGYAIYKFDLDTNAWTIYPNAQKHNETGSGYGLFSLSSSAGGSADFSNLTINGVSVQGQIDDNKTAINNNRNAIRKNKKAIDTNRTNINNLGDGIAASTALGAALSALPVTPDDAPFSCGVGSGAYSSRFAMGLGCVAKLNQRLSLNAGGSHVFGGSSNYGGGSLDSVAWRGGFVLKLGKLDSPAATNEQLQSKVKELEERNAAVDAKYSAIQEENKDLRARLERLEAIALGQQPATTTASLK